MDSRWIETPPYGACITCGTSSNIRGFVDLIAEVDITRENHRMIGNVDVILCSDCITQAARQVGCVPAEEAEAMSWNISELTDAVEKAEDEAASWQQRYENLVEIMAMIQLHGSSDNPIEPSPDGGPSPDLRVQEGELVNSQSDGAVAKRRKNARG